MKKLLFVLALGAFAACGGGENKENTADSTKKDSIVAPAAADSLKKDSVVTPAADSLKKDSAVKK